MVLSHIQNKVLDYLNSLDYQAYIKNNIFIFMIGLPFLGVYFNGLVIFSILIIVFFYEFFYGTKKSNWFFVFMSVIYVRLYMLPPIEGGEIEFYIAQTSGAGEYSLVSFLEPVTFILLQYFDMFFSDVMTTIKFFRVLTAIFVFILLYHLLNKLKVNRQTLFLMVFSFMFWHTQIIGFELDQLKNFFAQVIFLIFLIFSINGSKWRFLFLFLLPLTHLTYAIVGFFIFLFNDSIFKNKMNYIKFSLIVFGLFIALLFIIPKLGIEFLSLSARIQSYVDYSAWKFDEQLTEKGGYLFTEVLSTNAIWTYIMIFLVVRHKYILDNITVRYLFIAWLVPFLISKLYLFGIPFVVDRFIMLYHGFWIIFSFFVFDRVIIKYTRFKAIKCMFVVYLALVTLVILIREQNVILENILIPDINNFIFHWQMFILIYSIIITTSIFHYRIKI